MTTQTAWSATLHGRTASNLGRQLPAKAGAWLRSLPWPFGWRWLVLGLIVRVALSPLHHTWDSQTWWNVAGELGGESNLLRAVGLPYEHMRQLSDLVKGSGLREHYEFWAYPPGMLLVWWPIARGWHVLVGPLAPNFAGPDALVSLPIPPLLSLAMKAPIIAADLVSAALLARLGSPSVARWYWLNPYVLLVGLWTFDGFMLACLLAGLVAARAQRWAVAGLLLGLGAAVKFVPALLVPVVMLWAVRSSARPLRSAGVVAATALAAFVAVCGPWLDGVQYVVGFHSARVGGGMAWQSVWGALAWIDPFLDLSTVNLYLSAQIGTLTLSGALVLTLVLAWLRGLDLLRMSLVVLLAYLMGSKLVNEVYALPAVALAAVVLESSWDVHLAQLLIFLWLFPLLFAAVNVPAWGFLLSPAQFVGVLTIDSVRQFHVGYTLTAQYLAPVLAAAGTLFQVGCGIGIWSVVRSGRAPHDHRTGALAA